MHLWAGLAMQLAVKCYSLSLWLSLIAGIVFFILFIGIFGKPLHHLGLSPPHKSRFGSLWHLGFPKVKIIVEMLQTGEYIMGDLEN